MKRQIIYGPPGTGKTTFLLGMIEKELETTQPHQIAFVSFTKQGTYEGVERAKERFGIKKEELKYFKTIHALCFKDLSLSRLDVINRTHYKLLSKATGINFTGYYTEDFTSSNDVYLHVVAMEKHNPELAFKLMRNLNEQRFNYIKFQYEEMKRQIGIVDFDDMLIDYLKQGKPVPVKVAFIDEAQDLTPLQWCVAMKMFSQAERIIVAGDDDQAVYEWSGADVRYFLNFTDNSTVLAHSYRMPLEILRLSKRITKDIKQRMPKQFNDSGEIGTILSEDSLYTTDLQGGELVLARTNWLLRQLSFAALNQGHYILFKGKPSIDFSVLKALRAYEKFCEGNENGISKFTMYFNSIDKKLPWQRTVKLEPYEISYYEKIMETNAETKAPILFETFHSCKGSENNHVILSYEMTGAVHENLNNNPDSELRCLYVGLTRAKEKLTILSPKVREHYPHKYFN